MTNRSGIYSFAAFFVLISSVLHIFAFVVGGLSFDALVLIPVGIVYFFIAAGLNRSLRWLAWIAFFVMCIGAIMALALSDGSSKVPGWWFTLIAAADALAAIGLFIALWRNPEPRRLF